MRKEERRLRREQRNRIRAEKTKTLERVNNALMLSEDLMNTDFEAEKWLKAESMLQTSQLTENRLRDSNADTQHELAGIGNWLRAQTDNAIKMERSLKPALDLTDYSLDNVHAFMGRMTSLRASLESAVLKMVQNAVTNSSQDDTHRLLQEQQERFVQQVILYTYMLVCVYIN